jgi:hypothetical protein
MFYECLFYDQEQRQDRLAEEVRRKRFEKKLRIFREMMKDEEEYEEPTEKELEVISVSSVDSLEVKEEREEEQRRS